VLQHLLIMTDLVDTFLLPSLVGAIFWLANHLWESRGDSNTVIQILQTLINPGSISSDANSMLSSILNITAKPLEHSLRWLQRDEPTRQDVEPLSKVLKPHLSFPRTAAADHTELESWSNSHGGIAASIRHTIQSLTQWSLSTGMNVMPTSYTHRQMLTGVRVLGAKRLLSAIIDEVKAQTANGSGAIVIDVASAIICAPDADSIPLTNSNHLMNMLDDTTSTPQPLQRRLTLRDALRTEAENAPKIHKTDVLQAETVIRLFRRVEVLMTVAIPQAGMLGHGLGGLEVDAGMEVGVGVGLGDGVLNGAQDIDDAIAAAADQEMMDALAAGEGMMVGDDDLLGDMKLDF
jgi:mediator of RNA polymerase II transcription subunit 5